MNIPVMRTNLNRYTKIQMIRRSSTSRSTQRPGNLFIQKRYLMDGVYFRNLFMQIF